MTNRNGKSIKKTHKIAFLFLGVLLLIPTVTYIALKQHSVQQYIVNRAAIKLSTFLGARVTISSAKIDLLSNITLTDFCVRTPKNDTILLTKQLIVKINAFTLTSRFLELKQITMVNPDINFYIDSTKTINFQFIIDKLESKGPKKQGGKGMIVSIKNIELKNADFSLKAFDQVPRNGINFGDLHLQPFSIKITNFRINSGIIDMRVREMKGIDKSGFSIKKFASRVKINKHFMVYNNLHINTPNSSINARQIKFNYNSLKDFKAGVFGKTVKLNLEFLPSDISSKDIAMFAPVVKDYNLRVKLSGTIKGSIRDLKGKDISVSYGSKTLIRGNFDINGLPDISSTFLHVDIKSLTTNPADIQSINLPKSKNGRIILPPNFKHITYLTYRGKFTGFTNDFVAYGTINSNLGLVESDLSIRPDTAHSLNFKGKIKSNQFDVGKFINNPEVVGRISLNAMVNGNIAHGKNITAKLDGVINSFDVKQYNYQNIKVNGTLSNNTYDGALAVSDPNIALDFLGKVNLSGQIPVFNFTANVKKANLHKLNLDSKDSSSFLQFYMTADFEGDNIDNLKGEIKLWNSTYQRGGKTIHVNDFLLFTKTINNQNQIFLRSDIADAELQGKYQFSKLASSLKLLTKHYLPSVVPENIDTTGIDNNFTFEVDLKDSRELTDFFVSGLYISKDSKLTGNFNPSKQDLNFLLKIPILQHKHKKWYNVYFDGKTNSPVFSLVSGCKNLKLSNSLNLDNFTILSEIKNDSIGTQLRWNNWDSIVYKGNLAFTTFLKRHKGQNRPSVQVQMLPSQLILKDTLWALKTELIKIDTTHIQISNFVMSHNNQSIKLNGAISQKPNSDIALELSNLDLGNLQTVFSPKKLIINGVINGKASVSNIFTNPIFRASLVIDSLMVNKEAVGKTKISAIYNSLEKKIQISANAERGTLNTLAVNGNYLIQEKALDFNIVLNKLKLNIFEPYISAIFSDVRGLASGTLTLTGNTKAPKLNGTVKTQKASFVVNYLKTRYNFTHVIEVNNNTFILKDIEAFDSNTNKAIVNGQIEYRNLKELHVDLQVDAKNLECLNTSLKDNSLFYGHGFATGKISMKISPKDGVNMIINATTAPNTNISIPLGTKMDLTESNFIKFKVKHVEEQPLDKYEIDKKAEKARAEYASNRISLDMILHLTPDAVGQIVFDEKIGDIIKGTGSGDLRMTLKNGVFNMDGVYNINKGDYLFTAGGIINKKFIVQPGGTISWNGDPLDATIDIQAAFNRLKPSLYQLVGDAYGERGKKKVDVDCRLFLSDKLMKPTIKYDIYLPYADQETRNIVGMYTSTIEDMSNQFLFLVIYNNFFPDQSSSSTASTSAGASGLSAASVTGIEFLSNQLSRMMSDLSKDFDIGFNYRPNDYVTTGQVEMAMSTQLLDDRVIINGNVDVGGQQITPKQNSNTSAVTTEGTVEVKITNNGKLRMKAFNRSNQNYNNFDDNVSQYTQGVGVFYKEDFNSFNELFKRYYKLIFARKEKQPKPINEEKKDKENSPAKADSADKLD